MKLSEILNKDSILSDMQSSDKSGIIKELAQAVASATQADAADIEQVLTERESLGSTGIGGGIAIPHGKLDSVGAVTVGFGLSRNGVEYNSLDSKPVHIFFLLLTPEHSTGGHLKVLAQISKLLKREEFKQGLKSAQSVDDIYETILAQDEEF